LPRSRPAGRPPAAGARRGAADVAAGGRAGHRSGRHHRAVGARGCRGFHRLLPEPPAGSDCQDGGVEAASRGLVDAAGSSAMPDNSNKYRFEVRAEPAYLEEQSDPSENRYVFAYTITIRNTGTVAARLISRHWFIVDANGNEREVRGDGVVGEQPHLRPGENFRYTSGAMLE